MDGGKEKCREAQTVPNFPFPLGKQVRVVPYSVPPSKQKLHKSTVSAGNKLSETLLEPGQTLKPGK